MTTTGCSTGTVKLPTVVTERADSVGQKATVAGRLRPLQLALFVAGIAPWVPVEKVFMTQLGFTPGLVAMMAAAYAAVVSVLEIPSGILADRWSRRGVLMLANGAALLSVVIGAVSTGVATYVASAMVLGVFFALQSGTVDSIVYDTLIEECGSGEGYERHYGRIQAWNSAALTGSALAGGFLAAVLSVRAAYLVTIPFAVAGILLLLRFREPTLHRQAARPHLSEHIRNTARVIAGRPRVAVIVLGSVLAAATLQMLFEFGPLWLLAYGVATAMFGPYTAGMTATLGLGGALAGRLHLDRPISAIAVTASLAVCAGPLAIGGSGSLVIAAQVTLAALLVSISIHLSKLLHDATPSALRTGVASAVSTLSWLTFLPAATGFGAASTNGGIHAAGAIVLVLVLGAGATLVALSSPARQPAAADVVPTTPNSTAVPNAA